MGVRWKGFLIAWAGVAGPVPLSSRDWKTEAMLHTHEKMFLGFFWGRFGTLVHLFFSLLQLFLMFRDYFGGLWALRALSYTISVPSPTAAIKL